MGALSKDFIEWQTSVMELERRGEEFARRIADLEKENALLQQRLLENEQGSGFDDLSGLYDDGFHICPDQFGKPREEDCLFCLNFLHHKGRK